LAAWRFDSDCKKRTKKFVKTIQLILSFLPFCLIDRNFFPVFFFLFFFSIQHPNAHLALTWMEYCVLFIVRCVCKTLKKIPLINIYYIINNRSETSKQTNPNPTRSRKTFSAPPFRSPPPPPPFANIRSPVSSSYTHETPSAEHLSISSSLTQISKGRLSSSILWFLFFLFPFERFPPTISRLVTRISSITLFYSPCLEFWLMRIINCRRSLP
jgi:hypothetical protein